MITLRPTRRSVSADAFTLIELLVVILIIGILIAVAAPSFLGQTDKAHESAVKQSLSVAYKAAKASATEREGQFVTTSFTAAQLASAITASEPQFTVATGSCPSDATADINHIVVDDNPAADLNGAPDPGYTNGDDLVICADPERRVWTLKVVDGGPPQITKTTIPEVSTTPPPPPSYEQTVLADSPTFYWRLDERAATSQHFPSIGSDTQLLVAGGSGINLIASGKRGNAATIGGSNYLLKSNSANMHTASFAFEIWFRADSLACPDGFCYVAWNGSYYIRIRPGGVLDWGIKDSDGYWSGGTTSVVAGQWYHAVLSYGDGVGRFYLDSSELWQQATTYNPASPDELRVGDRGDSYRLTGAVDEVAVYASPLTAARVSSHYDAG